MCPRLMPSRQHVIVINLSLKTFSDVNEVVCDGCGSTVTVNKFLSVEKVTLEVVLNKLVVKGGKLVSRLF